MMYCNNWCPDCRRARAWLDRHGIEYREINVSRDREAAQQVREWADGNLVTPTFDIQGEIVIDWDEAALSKLLL
jgi:thioredoxin reductase (NADPH)